MSPSSINGYNINQDLIEGSDIFVDEGSTFEWTTELMDVYLFDGNYLWGSNKPFQTIQFETLTSPQKND